jgi:hypothetical protein
MNMFNQLIKSLYSPKDIARFRFQGIGKTILYVFFLTLLSSIPTFVYLQTAIMSGVTASLETIEQELPNFTINNGQLQADQKTPVTINKDEFTIIMDSTGNVETKELKNSDNTIAFLKNELVFIAGGDVQTYPYSMTNDLNLTKKDLIDLVNTVDSSLVIILPILFLVIYLFSLGMKFVEVSILALIGYILKNGAEKKLSYGHVWRLSAYSVTLPTIFFMIMKTLKTTVPSSFFIHWIVAIIILFLTIKEIPQNKK